MDDQNREQPNDESQQSLESLDAPETTIESANGEVSADNGDLASPDSGGLAAPPGQQDGQSPGGKPKRSRRWLHGSNAYLAGFLFIVLVAVGIAVYAFSRGGQSNQSNTQVPSQNLSPEALKQLAGSDVTVGGPKQILTVQSNAIFDGQVLVKRGLSVAGSLQIGGNLSLPNIVVSGTSQFGGVQINKDLSVAGKETVQGALAVQNNLTVKGGGNFGGPINAPQLTVNSMQLNGELTLTHHIEAGGGTPGQTSGGALGSGGSATVSGSDTAGSITISTGGGPPAGCFIRINFTAAFHATPHVIITPVGSSAASLKYYVTRDTNGFSVCSASTPPSNSNFGFDYIAFD